MEKAIHKLLDSCATHPNDTLQYKSKGVILRAHSDATYLSKSQSSSRGVVFFYMGDATNDLRKKWRDYGHIGYHS